MGYIVPCTVLAVVNVRCPTNWPVEVFMAYDAELLVAGQLVWRANCGELI